MSKETYPAPRAKGARKNPTPPPVHIKTSNPHPRPEDCLTGTQKEWEEAIFRYANHFTVFRFGVMLANRSRERISVVYNSFPKALADAGPDEQALVYAVTLEGRSFCIPRSEWDKYSAIWRERT